MCWVRRKGVSLIAYAIQVYIDLSVDSIEFVFSEALDCYIVRK